MKILVVEDDENSRALQHVLLEADGFEVVSAANGREALPLLQVAPLPDLILSDIMMPEMDGYALCRYVRNDPALAGIPFVFYTATYTEDADRQLAEDLGATRFLIKPMDPGELLGQIRQLLAARPPAPKPKLEQVDAKYAAVIARKLDQKVSEIKEVRARLDSSEERLRHVEECHRITQRIARVGGWDWDLAADAWWWSDEVYRLLGLEPGARPASRELLESRVVPEDRERFALALELAATRGVVFKLEYRVLGAADEPRRVRAEGEIVAADPATGRPLRIIGAMQDITEQRYMEEEKARLEHSLRQSQKMEALGALASGIAHDFNNMLSGIVGGAELLRLRMTMPSAEDRDLLDQVVAAGRRAIELVRQIVVFSRKGEMAKSATDLGALVREALKLLQVSLPHNVEVRSELDPACPPVLAEPTQIYQVILNLGVNAQQAMASAGGVLGLALRAEEVRAWDPAAREGVKPGAYAVLTVSDTGCGMDALTRERLFEPYFTTKQQSGGTGLGLAVVHGIVLHHNGHIRVASTPGQGTTFDIFLPVPRTAAAPVSTRPAATGRGEGILLVDDSPAMRSIFAPLLVRHGYRVSVAGGGPEALALFKPGAEKFDLVITDLSMPEMDGIVLARRIGAAQPGLPILLCTGFAEMVDQRVVAESGIREVLTKPILQKDLLDAVRRALQARAGGLAAPV